ncbi:hypothetical protein K439DRAFT_1656454 [Ramaria rubella]|nr:hypothetical protein K439DRAFT_1656454 [Ramaria rubella]
MSSPTPIDHSNPQAQDSWAMDPTSETDNVHMNDAHDGVNTVRAENGGVRSATSELEDPGPLLPSKTAGGPDLGVPGAKTGTIYREKQIKPNKVYVGGLPEHTRQEDLQSCFGKIGRIASIELKLGFGFVEFVDRDAAEESVAKYHEGYFMGNKIRVELSHGGGRTAKFPGEPGACFKCGQMGHWARECPNHVVTVGHRGKSEATLLDRVSHPPREFAPPPPSRGYSPYREDYRAPPSARDSRYTYDYPPPTRDVRDYRVRDRPPSPPRDLRDYRDFPAGPLPRTSRDIDDYRRDYKGPPPSRYDNRPGYYAEVDYIPRPSYVPPPPPREIYDSRGGYEKRTTLPPTDRYPPYPPPVGGGRSRTPPRGREDYDKAIPSREYPQHPDYRGRPTTPPGARYSDAGRASGPIDGSGAARYRRRSQSPVARSGSYSSGPPPPPMGYSGTAYPPPPGGFAGGYPNLGSSIQGRPPMGGGPRDRDYPPRSGRDSDPSPYSRRP